MEECKKCGPGCKCGPDCKCPPECKGECGPKMCPPKPLFPCVARVLEPAPCFEEQVGMMTARGQFVVCETKDIRAIGRVARGVKGITLNAGDELVSAKPIPSTTKEYLSVSEKGYIKRTSAKEFTVTGRGTKGGKIHALKDSDDKLINFVPLTTEKEVIVVSSNSQIKINLNDVNLLSKGAQGTKSMKLSNSKIIGLLAF